MRESLVLLLIQLQWAASAAIERHRPAFPAGGRQRLTVLPSLSVSLFSSTAGSVGPGRLDLPPDQAQLPRMPPWFDKLKTNLGLGDEEEQAEQTLVGKPCRSAGPTALGALHCRHLTATAAALSPPLPPSPLPPPLPGTATDTWAWPPSVPHPADSTTVAGCPSPRCACPCPAAAAAAGWRHDAGQDAAHDWLCHLRRHWPAPELHGALRMEPQPCCVLGSRARRQRTPPVNFAPPPTDPRPRRLLHVPCCLMCALLQAPMFIFHPTKFSLIYCLSSILSLCR